MLRMKKLLEKYSIESLRSRSEHIVFSLVNALYKLGYRIPISQTIDFIKILETYMVLKHYAEPSYPEIIELAESVFTTINWSPKLKQELLDLLERKRVRLESGLSQKIVSRIRFGREVNVREILSGRLCKSDIETYIVMRKLGIIHRIRSGKYRAVKYNEYRRTIKKHRDYSISASDIIKYLDEIPMGYWSMLLSQDVIDKASYKTLFKLAEELVKTDNERLKKLVLNRLSHDISSTTKLSSRERRVLQNLLRTTNYSDLRLSLKAYRDVSRDLIDRYGLRDLIKEVKSLSISERRRVLSKLVKYLNKNELEQVVNEVDILSFTRIPRLDKTLSTIYKLANALTSFIDYKLTQNPSFLDYSLYYLKDIDANTIPLKYRPLYESLIHRDLRTMVNKLSIVELHSLVEYVIGRTVELRNLGYSDEVLANALTLSMRVLRNIVGRHGGFLVEKRKTMVHRGRVEVKDSLYHFVRHNYSLVYTYRVRKPSIVALLDVSGSMRNYSLWAITTLASIIYRVRLAIVFSDKCEVIRFTKYPIRLLHRFLKTILMSRFNGYTDIDSALTEALRYIRSGDVVVLISDLKQTVKGDPVQKIKRVVDRGTRFIAITPKHYSVDLANAIRELSGEVIVSSSPLEIPYILRKKLNLKIGIRI